MISQQLHEIAKELQDFSNILLHMHVIALLIINVTKVPRTSALAARLYKGLEMVAGLLTPLAKR